MLRLAILIKWEQFDPKRDNSVRDDSLDLPFEIPAPAGLGTTPVWTGNGFLSGAKEVRVLEYSENFAGWSDDLTNLIDESSGGTHPIDLASRSEAVEQLRRHLHHRERPVILEIGCSSGFLLRDIREQFPHAFLCGADTVREPLFRLADTLPGIPLFRFDLLQSPLPEGTFDAVVILNVLEHIEDDRAALEQIYRLLKPGGIAVLEVPAGPDLFDDYDRALKHFRRYSIDDLSTKLRETGFRVVRRSHLGCLLYPAFAFIKSRKREIPPDDLHLLVKNQTRDSSGLIVKWIMKLEIALGRWISFPVGIRCLVTAIKQT